MGSPTTNPEVPPATPTSRDLPPTAWWEWPFIVAFTPIVLLMRTVRRIPDAARMLWLIVRVVTRWTVRTLIVTPALLMWRAVCSMARLLRAAGRYVAGVIVRAAVIVWGVLALCARAAWRALKVAGRQLLAVLVFFAPVARACRVMVVMAARAVVQALRVVVQSLRPVWTAGCLVMSAVLHAAAVTAHGVWWLLRPIVRLMEAVTLSVVKVAWWLIRHGALMSWTAVKEFTVLALSVLVWLASWSFALAGKWMRAAGWLLDQLWVAIKWVGRVLFVAPARAGWKFTKGARRRVVVVAGGAWRATLAVGRRGRRVVTGTSRRVWTAMRRGRARMRESRRRVTERLAGMWRR